MNVSLSHFDLWVGSEVGVELSLAAGAGDVEGWEGSVELARPGGAPSRTGFDLIELTRGVRPASRAFRATEKGVHKFTVLLAHPESGAELRGSREFFVTDPTDFPTFSERSRQRAHWKPRPHDPDFITVNIPVDVAERARHVHMHAEVHLYDSVGALSSPVAWISGMVTPSPCIYAGQGAVCLSLSLHRGWFARAKLALDDPRGKINLELRHVRLKDPNQEVVVGSLDSPLYLLDAEDAAEWLEEALTDSDFPEEAAEPQKSLLEVQMREGPLAGDWVNGGAWSDISARPGGSAEPDTPQLLLVGGFCSTEAPFPLTDFHRAISATWDPGIAVSNDVFARRILRFSLEKRAGSLCGRRPQPGGQRPPAPADVLLERDGPGDRGGSDAVHGLPLPRGLHHELPAAPPENYLLRLRPGRHTGGRGGLAAGHSALAPGFRERLLHNQQSQVYSPYHVVQPCQRVHHGRYVQRRGGGVRPDAARWG